MRMRLGDLVRMPLPDQPSPDYLAPYVPPMIPGLPADLAGDFLTSMSPGGTIPAYAVDTDTPIQDRAVVGGPGLVAAMPNGNIPVLQPAGQPPWMRTPVLPDSMLPFALQRDSWAKQPSVFTKNIWDREIASESALWEYVAAHGGIKTCCRIPELGAPIYSYPPWQVMPSNGLRFGPDRIFFQPLADISGGPPFNGTDTILGQFRCPVGFDGAITHFLCGFTGNGFSDGSGQIVWRLKIGQRYANQAGNVTFTFGDLKTALTVPGSAWRLISGQTVQLIANIPALSPVAGGRVFAGVLGWTYPRR